MGYYDVGLVCLNGHEINRNSQTRPESNTSFCKNCGEPTINKCPKCSAAIQGEYEVSGVACIGFSWHAPKHCHNCGAPYPWTQRKLDALSEAIEELDELSAEDREKLKDAIPDVINKTPKTDTATARFKKAIKNAGSAGGKLLTDVLSQVAVEVVKKSIGI